MADRTSVSAGRLGAEATEVDARRSSAVVKMTSDEIQQMAAGRMDADQDHLNGLLGEG